MSEFALPAVYLGFQEKNVTISQGVTGVQRSSRKFQTRLTFGDDETHRCARSEFAPHNSTKRFPRCCICSKFKKNAPVRLSITKRCFTYIYISIPSEHRCKTISRIQHRVEGVEIQRQNQRDFNSE